MDERLYWLSFSQFPGVGPKTFRKLTTHFGSAKAAWEAPASDLRKVLGETLFTRFERFRKAFNVDRNQRELGKKHVSFLILSDKEYPSLLTKIPNPPFVLYVRGEGKALSSHSLAVVGTRTMTQYGSEVTNLLASELVQAEFTIVSGLALGVDAAAHRGALAAGGKTIAVLGCGVDCCSPGENQALYDKILKNGCIVSELPLGHPPTKGSFPSRNRIIAGLSLGVLVTEGAEDSGALITADYARKFGRPVFAVPGPITSTLSKGPYKLIEKGARLVTSAADILEELGITKRGGPPSRLLRRSGCEGRARLRRVKGDTKEETVILIILANEPLHFDEIVKRTKMDSSVVGSTLSLMEIKGMVKSQESGVFSIAT